MRYDVLRPLRLDQAPYREEAGSVPGWRRMGVCLTALTASLATLLTAGLLVSLLRYGSGLVLSESRSVIYSGLCSTVSRSNLGIHLAINAVASGILASSNFFMQVLVAPTRRHVNEAHARGRWLEIGVQSLRNVPSLPRRSLVLWVFFALSSLPLHLVFNGCIIQTKASTDLLAIAAAPAFLRGGPYSTPPLALDPVGVRRDFDETLRDISESLSGPESTQRWERINFSDCMDRYHDFGIILTSYRHVIMVLGYPNGSTEETGWTASSVLTNTLRPDIRNPDATNTLWSTMAVSRGDYPVANIRDIDHYSLSQGMRYHNFIDSFDRGSGRIIMNGSAIRSPYLEMQVQYCMSERFEVPCRLEVENGLLMVVCIMCVLKCVLCIIVLVIRRQKTNDALLTPGDAIESFLMEPDIHTAGVCTLSRDDPVFKAKSGDFGSYLGPRRWAVPTRRAGRAVAGSIWILSYTLIGCSIAVGAAMFGLAAHDSDHNISDTFFGHDGRNDAVHGTEKATLLEMTMLANTPQLILSICYMVYNGLYTRMLAEFEWASFSTRYQPLRVTKKKGQQRSTYRLQLPYRWSVPLLVVSLLLHWLYSNTLYVSLYEGHSWSWPYGPNARVEGLQYSTVSILIALITTITIAALPLLLARRTLPGKMVIAGGNSAVISAACHAASARADRLVSSPAAQKLSTGVTEPSGSHLYAMATGLLKWGDLSTGPSDGEPRLSRGPEVGHLGFGSMDQDVSEPIEGQRYGATGAESHPGEKYCHRSTSCTLR